MTQIDNIIKLDQFLKWVGVAPTGGQAKLMILDGNVLVNGEIETRRGRKLVTGDRVTVGNETFTVELDNPWIVLDYTSYKNLLKIWIAS